MKIGPKKKFTDEQFLTLPSYGCAYQYAKRLGVRGTTVFRWYTRYGLPVKKSVLKNSVVIELSKFIEWCKSTGRYEEKKK